MKRFGVLVNWARFRHRSSHVPNLTDKLSTAKEWRLNEFGMAVLIRCARNVKVDRVCRIIRHWSGMWFVRRSSQVPNLMHTCIHWIYNFSHNTARFYVVAMPRTLNWEKRRVKKNNLASLALRVQNILVYGAGDTSVSLVLSSRMMKGQTVKRLESRQFSRILWAMFPRSYGGARKDRM